MIKPLAAYPAGHPILAAWNEYIETADYRDDQRYARDLGVAADIYDSAIWEAFAAGYRAALKDQEATKIEIIRQLDEIDKRLDDLITIIPSGPKP